MTMKISKKEKIARAKKLDKAIHDGMKKFGIVLSPGIYAALRDGDVCGCAIGSAILATAKDRPQVRKLINKIDRLDHAEFAGMAVEIINAGVELEDLQQMEAGFERWNESEATVRGLNHEGSPVKLDYSSPFYKLGVKLRQEQIAKAAEKEAEELNLELAKQIKNIRKEYEDHIKSLRNETAANIRNLNARHI